MHFAVIEMSREGLFELGRYKTFEEAEKAAKKEKLNSHDKVLDIIMVCP